MRGAVGCCVARRADAVDATEGVEMNGVLDSTAFGVFAGY